VLGAFLSSALGVIARCKDYTLLDLPAVVTRLSQPPDQNTSHPESGVSRALFDCPDLALLPEGPRVRFIVAPHPTTSTAKPPVGVLRAGTVYELFLTTASPSAFPCADVLDLYLHRGSFETVLSDEDREQATDRWCSHTACGQQFWQILNQWLWNLRLEFGQRLAPASMRLTEFAKAKPEVAATSDQQAKPEVSATEVAPVLYGPPKFARRSFTKGFTGADFALQFDGTLRCPAGHPLTVQERRPERNGSVRVVYGARIIHCRPCPYRSQCQEATTTKKPASGSVPCSGLSKPPQTLQPHPLPSPLLTQSFGEIGHAVNCAVDGEVCFGHKWSISPVALHNTKRRERWKLSICKPEPSGHTGVSVGRSAWLAMLADLTLPHLRSRSTDFLPLLLSPLA
jgi:hypothetical protein